MWPLGGFEFEIPEVEDACKVGEIDQQDIFYSISTLKMPYG